MNKFLCALVLMILLIPVSTFAADTNSSKTAILVVSFGTSMPEARKAIDNLVDAAKENFPDSEVRLSFTSNIIRRKIARYYRHSCCCSCEIERRKIYGYLCNADSHDSRR